MLQRLEMQLFYDCWLEISSRLLYAYPHQLSGACQPCGESWLLVTAIRDEGDGLCKLRSAQSCHASFGFTGTHTMVIFKVGFCGVLSAIY
jgi:hypothetical protein